MANYYVRSSDGDSGNPGTPEEPFDRVVTALTAMSAGDKCYVSDLHNNSPASASTFSGGTASAPKEIICIEDWGAETDPGSITHVGSTGAVDGSSGTQSLFFEGFGYSRGVNYPCGTGGPRLINFAPSASSSWWRLEDCWLGFPFSDNRPQILVGIGNTMSRDNLLEFRNVEVHFGHVSQSINLRAELNWIGGGLRSAGYAPTTLFTGDSGGAGIARCRNLDLSAMSAKTLFGAGYSQRRIGVFSECRLASDTVAVGTIASLSGTQVELVDCSSAATNYAYFFKDYRGTIYAEDTNINQDSVSPIGRRMVSNASASWSHPLIMDHLARYNAETTDPITITVEIMTDGVTLTDKDIWPVVSYLGNASYPLGSLATERADYFATGTNWATSTADWDDTDITTLTRQKMEITFSPKMAGPLLIGVHLAKPSTTAYVDMAPAVS